MSPRVCMHMSACTRAHTRHLHSLSVSLPTGMQTPEGETGYLFLIALSLAASQQLAQGNAQTLLVHI